LLLTVVGFWGAYPEENGATSGYLLEDGEKIVLIDCGSAVLSKIQNLIELREIDAVVLSHYHADHIADIKCLQYAASIDMILGKRRNTLQIYGHKYTEDFDELSYLDATEGIPIREESTVKIGSMNFTFSRTVHPDPSLAIRVQKGNSTIVYTGDTAWYEDLVNFSMYADLLICESSLYNANAGAVEGHMTAGEAGKLAKMTQARRLLLTHLPHFGNHEQLIEEAAENYSGPIDLASQITSLKIG